MQNKFGQLLLSSLVLLASFILVRFTVVFLLIASFVLIYCILSPDCVRATALQIYVYEQKKTLLCGLLSVTIRGLVQAEEISIL